MKIAIASDHGGIELKSLLVNELSSVAQIVDEGPAGKCACDYPDYAVAVAKDVASGEADFGILICRSGIGMSRRAISPTMRTPWRRRSRAARSTSACSCAVRAWA